MGISTKIFYVNKIQMLDYVSLVFHFIGPMLDPNANIEISNLHKYLFVIYRPLFLLQSPYISRKLLLEYMLMFACLILSDSMSRKHGQRKSVFDFLLSALL